MTWNTMKCWFGRHDYDQYWTGSISTGIHVWFQCARCRKIRLL